MCIGNHDLYVGYHDFCVGNLDLCVSEMLCVGNYSYAFAHAAHALHDALEYALYCNA